MFLVSLGTEDLPVGIVEVIQAVGLFWIKDGFEAAIPGLQMGWGGKP